MTTPLHHTRIQMFSYILKSSTKGKQILIAEENIYTYVCISIYTYICLYVCIQIFTHVYVNTFICTYGARERKRTRLLESAKKNESASLRVKEKKMKNLRITESERD